MVMLHGDEEEAGASTQPMPTTTVDTLEDAADAAIREEYRHILALATRMTVVSVKDSNNVGDQAADFQAQQQGRPRAVSFTTEQSDEQLVEFDDFDFRTGQPIESKSIAAVVNGKASRAEAIHEFQQKMTKQAIAARDNQVFRPVRWDVPPDVHQDVIDIHGSLPKDLRDWIVIGPPTAPIRVTPTTPPPDPPPPKPRPKK
jgi:hypothetical protein